MKIGSPQIENPSEDLPKGIDYFVNMFGLPQDGVFYHCPCCGYPTLAARGSFEVCPICFWEDDGQDQHDAQRVRGGPNRTLSLSKAKENFRVFAACDQQFAANVRAPNEDEKRYRNNDD